MKLKAIDTLHVSSVQADNIAPGEQFEVGDAEGKVLVDRGLAKAVAEKKADAPEAKAEAAPQNKAEPAPLNKDSAPITTTKRARKA